MRATANRIHFDFIFNTEEKKKRRNKTQAHHINFI